MVSHGERENKNRKQDVIDTEKSRPVLSEYHWQCASGER